MLWQVGTAVGEVSGTRQLMHIESKSRCLFALVPLSAATYNPRVMWAYSGLDLKNLCLSNQFVVIFLFLVHDWLFCSSSIVQKNDKRDLK
jgi:hypothetical protein